MTEWRQTPGGDWQYQADDGNWYFGGGPETGDADGAEQQWEGPTQPHEDLLPAGGWLAIIGGGLLVVGSILPWWTVSAGGLTSIASRNGFQLGANGSLSATGPICVLLGVVTVVIGIVRLTNASMPRFLQRSPIITGLGAGLVTVGEVVGLEQTIHMHSTRLFSQAVGYGLWLSVVGAVVIVVSGFVLRSATREVWVAGWYEDPKGKAELRWWNGRRWTRSTTSAGRLDKLPDFSDS